MVFKSLFLAEGKRLKVLIKGLSKYKSILIFS